MTFEPLPSEEEWISCHPRRRARALRAHTQGGDQIVWSTL